MISYGYAAISITRHVLMHVNKLLRFATMFQSLAAGEELPPNSKDLAVVLRHLEELETYHARVKYAEANLEHLSSGSSRVVYLTNKKTVIKLAKNDKGIAQNKVEADPKMKSKHLNTILSHAKNCAWIETNYLDKITEKEFEKMTGIKFEDFGLAIRYGLKSVSGNTDKEKPENFDEVSKSDIYKELRDVGSANKLMPGDMARISSWGTKDGRPVLIDAGLSKDVFADYYEDSSS
jgi:hypothetical protein